MKDRRRGSAFSPVDTDPAFPVFACRFETALPRDASHKVPSVHGCQAQHRHAVMHQLLFVFRRQRPLAILLEGQTYHLAEGLGGLLDRRGRHGGSLFLNPPPVPSVADRCDGRLVPGGISCGFALRRDRRARTASPGIAAEVLRRPAAGSTPTAERPPPTPTGRGGHRRGDGRGYRPPVPESDRSPKPAGAADRSACGRTAWEGGGVREKSLSGVSCSGPAERRSARHSRPGPEAGNGGGFGTGMSAFLITPRRHKSWIVCRS